MNSHGGLSREDMESRRLQAVADINAGVRGLARKYGVSRMTVVRWRRAVKSGGDLTRRKAHGRPRKLTAGQDLVVTALYVAGPSAFYRGRSDDEQLRFYVEGWHLDRWHRREFREAIRLTIGVEFDPDHVGRIMHRLGWPKQKRGRRAA